MGLLEEVELSYRLYFCRPCGVQLQICLQWDRGNIDCAGSARNWPAVRACGAPAPLSADSPWCPPTC